MILRPVADGLLCVRQPDHAALAAAIARAWGGAFPRLRPLESVELAIRIHDDGWTEVDAEPRWNPDGGLLHTYRTLPRVDALAVAERSVARAAAADPYAGWLVSRHFASFHADAEDPEARRWVVDQVAHRAELLSRAWPRAGRDALHPHVLEGNVDVLQLLDALSLALCEGWPEWESRETSAAYGEGTTAFRYRRIGRADVPGTVGTVDPWPFAVPAIASTVPARAIPAGPWPDADALRRDWAAGARVVLEVALARG